MTWKGGSANGSSSAIYLPRINRTLVDQLESHLRSFNLTDAKSADEPERAPIPRHSTAAAAGHSSSLQADQLESTLLCVKKAARTMADLVEQAGAVGERERLRTALTKVEDRLSVFEQDFEAMSAQLRDARRDAEEQRCRALVAEDRLENLMEAVTKMIAPLGHNDSFEHILPAESASTNSYGGRA